MNLERSLARAFLEDHPRDAAMVLERLEPAEAIEVLSGGPPAPAAATLRWMAPASASAVIDGIEIARAAELVTALPIDGAAAVLRRLDDARRDSLLATLPAELRDALRRLLAFPAGSAGALMDPRVTALVNDRTAAEALESIRRTDDSTLFNLYVIDRERRLVGVVNLDELLSARPGATLGAIARPAELRIPVGADRQQIVTHPGWKRVYSLPVVDTAGVFLGAIRYRTLRQLESELAEAPGAEDTSTARALGDLFAAGLGGIVDAIAQSMAPSHRSRRPSGD